MNNHETTLSVEALALVTGGCAIQANYTTSGGPYVFRRKPGSFVLEGIGSSEDQGEEGKICHPLADAWRKVGP